MENMQLFFLTNSLIIGKHFHKPKGYHSGEILLYIGVLYSLKKTILTA